jgi:hypothetical protein
MADNGIEATAGDSGEVVLAGQMATFRGGANWFYWIAALSVVNTLISLFQGGWGFIFGLGVTQIVDAIAAVILEEQGDSTGLIRIIALGASVFFAGFFALFGWLANQRQGWAFLVGMVLYLLDGLLFLLVQDWLSLAFHGFALFRMFQGYQALREIRAVTDPAPTPPEYSLRA